MGVRVFGAFKLFVWAIKFLCKDFKRVFKNFLEYGLFLFNIYINFVVIKLILNNKIINKFVKIRAR